MQFVCLQSSLQPTSSPGFTLATSLKLPVPDHQFQITFMTLFSAQLAALAGFNDGSSCPLSLSSRY